MTWIVAGMVSLACGGTPAQPVVDLSGPWSVRLGTDGAVPWVPIEVPGSTDLAGLGTPEPVAHGRLTRRYVHVGPATYRRNVSVPESWRGQRVELFLERCHWVSTVRVDGRTAGTRDSLAVAHVYDLTELLPPGEHVLEVTVDNTPRYGISQWASSVTEHSQTNWNGIIGRMELRALPGTGIGGVRAFPDAARGQVRVSVAVTGSPSGRIGLTVRDSANGVLAEAEQPASEENDVTLDLPPDTPCWDEFAPALLMLDVVLRAADGTLLDTNTLSFGLRDFRAGKDHFMVNGRTAYLRGTLEAALHPSTGHPPMDVARWREILEVVKAHGLNHVRFHAWCPPEAAFAVADELGLYLQPECPWWGQVDGEGQPDRPDFLRREALRILETYGNHPSFCMFSMGNELGTPHGEFLSGTVRLLRERDPQRVYTTTSGHFIPTDYDHDFADDYFVSLATPEGALRGHGRLDALPPDTTQTYTPLLERIDRPMVLHELGQWTMYPDLGEAAKYAGPTYHGDYERARRSLVENGLGHLNPAFTEASGALLVELYKEEVECAMRTADTAGFQLLGLTDQAGWGCATIGVRDGFWASKGIVTAEGFRRFCAPTVPLARMARRTWRAGETFTAEVTLHHHGAAALKDVRVAWHIEDAGGARLGEGALAAGEVPTGGNHDCGTVRFDLARVEVPSQLRLILSVEGTEAANDWDFWVYGAEAAPAPGNVLLTTSWEAAKTALREGGRVVLDASNAASGHRLPLRFTPLFWAFGFNPHGTYGLLCQAGHPALAAFPALSYGGWPWWEPTHDATSFILDNLPVELDPIVRVIDNFNRNQRLGAVFEARVGAGCLLVSSLGLAPDNASQWVTARLRDSLLGYAASEDFEPPVRLEEGDLAGLLGEYPLARFREEPPDFAGALLHVVTAAGGALAAVPQEDAEANRPFALVPRESDATGLSGSDTVLAREEGFDYVLRHMGAALAEEWMWSDHRPELRVTVPRGFSGWLHLHFLDWNSLGRRARIAVDGVFLGDLDDYGGAGTWLRIPVEEATTRDGSVVVNMRTISGGNTLLRAFAVEAP